MSRNNIIYGDKHTFTSYSNDEVFLTAGAGQQLTIQGSVNLVNKYGDNADLKINGTPLSFTSSGLVLNSLSDCNIGESGAPAEGQLLYYGTSNKWVNKGIYLNNLDDVYVATNTLANNQILVYTQDNFVNRNPELMTWTSMTFESSQINNSFINLKAGTQYDFGFSGQDYGWGDIIGEPNARGGASEPTYTEITGSGGFYSYQFDHTGASKYLYFTFHIPHDYKPDSPIYPHVHFCNAWTTNADVGVVKWELYSAIFPSNQAQSITFGYNTFNTTTTAFISGAGGRAIISETANGYFTGAVRVDDLIILRLTRDNTVVGNYAQPVWVQLVDLHYQSNKLTTKNKSAPFYT